MRFPLPYVPTITYKGGNGFGGDRSRVRKGLKHAANDLAGPPGTPVLAMDDGVVIRGPYPFFFQTSALEIKHPKFIARYCEIDRKTEVKAGDTVKEGQVIGYIGNQPGADMLHIEFFSGKLTGDLTQHNDPPYDRRGDVFDGAGLLDQTKGTAGRIEGNNTYRYRTDSDGRKFLDKMDLRDN